MSTFRIAILSIIILAYSNFNLSAQNSLITSKEKMKVEIWSDVMCPFCYIGKRKFEQALENFPQKDQIEVVWKSYQLDPSIKYTPGKDVFDMLAEKKGKTREWALEMNKYVTSMANEVGLVYDMINTKPSNTFDAHRLSHLAKQYNLQNKAEERLFRAYFCEGKNLEDKNTLVSLANEIGMDSTIARKTLESDAFSKEVYQDEMEANKLQISGVPYFYFNKNYSISGAQPVKEFTQSLEKAFKDWEKNKQTSKNKSNKGKVCTPDGVCK